MSARLRSGSRKSLGLLRWVSVGCFALACKSPAEPAAQEPSSSVEAPEPEPEPPLPEQPLARGQQVHDFRALGHNGQGVRLSHFSSRPVVVYFCPSIEDASCAQLTKHLRDAWLELAGQLSMVFGVSGDGVVVQRAFASAEKLPQLLLSDSDHQLHRTFGLEPGQLVSYLIGAERAVLRVFQPPSGERHVQEVLEALEKLDLRRAPPPP